jgi:hypothetical protein
MRTLAFLTCFFCLLGLPASAPPARGEPRPRPEQIAFVHLRFTGDTVQLLGCKVAPGHLKHPGRSRDKGIRLQVATQDGQFSWQGWIKDPRSRVVEAPDADGHFTAKVVTWATAEVTVRVPFFESGQNLLVSRAPAAANENGSAKLLASLQITIP